jgi:nucleolar protein TMA23
MDASAYLKKQGWRGTGHSLDHTDRGIKKPLLIAHKQDTLGLGKKKAMHNVDDQWWMRAFDESLKNIGTGQESTLSQVRKQGINRGGLYGFFVKGEGLVGTISNSEESSAVQSSADMSRESTPPTSPEPAEVQSKKRKRDGESSKEVRKRQREEIKATDKSGASKEKRRKRSKAVETYDEAAEKQILDEVGASKADSTDKEAKSRRKAEKRAKQAETDATDTTKSKRKAERRKKKQDQIPDNGEIADEDVPINNDEAALIAVKISKLTDVERLQYEERAKAKKQTLEQYVLRRIQKKDEKKYGKDGALKPAKTDVVLKAEKRTVMVVEKKEKRSKPARAANAAVAVAA